MLRRGADATLQIIIQGRGGQGAQLAGNVLARAFFAEGREVQSFATYGGARRGTPVSSFIRVDDKPIRVRCDIERADAILCFDASLLEAKLLAAAGPRTLVVVNSRRTRAQFAVELPGYRVLPVDGIGISQRNGLGRIVNSALLGALACALEAPELDTLLHTVAAAAPKAGAENGAACLEGYRLVEAQLALQAA
jgi:pyruvate ferredoxin oxidoreductase gamma subunit